METVKSYPAVLTPLRRGTVGQVLPDVEEDEVVDGRLDVEVDRVLVEVVRTLLALEPEPGKH